MKINFMRKAMTLVVSGACAFVLSAGANTIVELSGVNGYGIGYDEPNLNPADYKTSNLQNMINTYNGVAFTPDTETYTVVSGDNSPATAPAPTGSLTSSTTPSDQTDPSVNITILSGYNYLIAHWDGANGANAVYYIPDSLWGQTVTLVNDLPGIGSQNNQPQDTLGLSGYWFSKADSIPSVPDGGATALLLGAALTGIGLLRRKLS